MKQLLTRHMQFLEKPRHTLIYFFCIALGSLILHLVCINNASLLVEEAYYWNYAQHLDFSYLDHPPMVALLIKLFTTFFGVHEYSVRAASIFCWFISAFYSYKLAELARPFSGRYAVLLLTFLPFFFIQSIIITPDVPLIACWSAALYYLYRALILNQPRAWYAAGIWLGLGMLSKYTICLLGLATLGYLVSVSNARYWFTRKEPYLGALISLILFTPVIYWNAQHDWISFIFQSSRRFSSVTSIDIHNLLWIALFFITPLGVQGLWELIKQKGEVLFADHNTKIFVRYFTLIPLVFFALYSLNHEINFNWIGPLFLALLPWLAALISTNSQKRSRWFATALFLLLTYTGVVLLIHYNKFELVQQKLLLKVISWDDLIQKLHTIAHDNEEQTQQEVVFVPLDNYPISSELAFYQTKFLTQGLIKKAYPIIGAHIFNRESLMYRYWSKNDNLAGKILILVSKEPWRFSDPEVTSRVRDYKSLSQVWSVGQGAHLKNIPYYYKIVQLNS